MLSEARARGIGPYIWIQCDGRMTKAIRQTEDILWWERDEHTTAHFPQIVNEVAREKAIVYQRTRSIRCGVPVHRGRSLSRRLCIYGNTLCSTDVFKIFHSAET